MLYYPTEFKIKMCKLKNKLIKLSTLKQGVREELKKV
jgi:hypothetical protein